MSTTFKAGLVQLDIELGQPDKNLNRANELVRQAQAQGAKLVLLPELWSTGYDLKNVQRHASALNQGIFVEMSRMARDVNVFLCGSALEARNGRFFNTMVVYSPAGELLSSYSKIHLFGMMSEPDFLAAGERLVTVNLPWGKAGLAICYDLRFPEIFRAYALGGAQMILLSAEWPHPRLEHWRTLLRARAIENQSFVLACNRVGTGDGNAFFGHSMVVDPWGEVIASGVEEEGIVIAELDLARVDEIRSLYPFLADRRAEIYSLG